MSMLVIAMLWLRYDRRLHSEGGPGILGVRAELWILVFAIVRVRVAVLERRCALPMGTAEGSVRAVLVAPLVASAAPWTSYREALAREHACLRRPCFDRRF